jgi:predicted secreted protein
MVNIRVDEVPFPSETYYFWSQDYFTRVYNALIDVIRAHGVGAEGWEAARWIVYDKVRFLR